MGTSELQDVLTDLAHGRDLTDRRAEDAFRVVFGGGATPAQIAAFAVSLRIKGETPVELAAGARVLRRKLPAFTPPPGTIDTCGTGGDGSRTLNVSTAVAFVVAGCGVPVAKHGGRAVTSASGSTDVLEALGVDVRVAPERALAVLHETGLTFLAAPSHHKALRHVSEVRKELGLRTIFNLLGPLANPAHATHHLLGVYDARWLRPIAEALHALGSRRAWIVHGEDGMDEITLFGTTRIAEMRDGSVREFTLDPVEYGFARPKPDALAGRDAEHNAAALRGLLSGKHDAYRDIVLLNAAAALVVAGRAASIEDGLALAAESIDSRAALGRLAALTESLR